MSDETHHERELGGTAIAWKALLGKESLDPGLAGPAAWKLGLSTDE